MASSFWNTALSSDETSVEAPHKISIKQQNIPQEEVHELAVDIYETEEKIYIVVPLAGVQSRDINISIDEDVLNVQGIRRNPFEEHESALYSSECFWGKFERQLTLPSSVDTRRMSASFRNGILLVEAERTSPSGSRSIKIS